MTKLIKALVKHFLFRHFLTHLGQIEENLFRHLAETSCLQNTNWTETTSVKMIVLLPLRLNRYTKKKITHNISSHYVSQAVSQLEFVP